MSDFRFWSSISRHHDDDRGILGPNSTPLQLSCNKFVAELIISITIYCTTVWNSEALQITESWEEETWILIDLNLNLQKMSWDFENLISHLSLLLRSWNNFDSTCNKIVREGVSYRNCNRIGNTISQSKLDYYGSGLAGSYWSNQHNFVEVFVTSLSTADTNTWHVIHIPDLLLLLFVCTCLQRGGDATGLMSAIMMQYTWFQKISPVVQLA